MPRSANRLRRLGGALADLERWLLPGACLLCDAALTGRDAGGLVCAVCCSRWHPIPGPHCDRCGQPRFADFECRICAGWSPGLDRVRSAVWLDGTARVAAHRLKYDGWSGMAEPMACAMRGLEPLTGRVCLIPIPLGARRLAERGYNQSERLAAALGGLIGAPVRAGLLTRVRETRTQTALTPEARHVNVAGAFHAGGAVSGRLVLVDDVFTTGATLCAAASALRSAGADAVEAVTFARAREMV